MKVSMLYEILKKLPLENDIKINVITKKSIVNGNDQASFKRTSHTVEFGVRHTTKGVTLETIIYVV